MKKVLFVLGTRPEAIKLAPLILAMKNQQSPKNQKIPKTQQPQNQNLKKLKKLIPVVCVTSQHQEILQQVLVHFNIVPDHDLNLMTEGQTLFDVTAHGLQKLQHVLHQETPDAVIVQGDTNTTFLASLAAYYKKIPIGHVEAGLRSQDKYNPFPEELFRRMTDALSDWCFAPTEQAVQNLRKENIEEQKIHLTGQTGIDALFMTLKKLKSLSSDKEAEAFLPSLIKDPGPGQKWDEPKDKQKIILITLHRRESFGRDLHAVCQGIKELAYELAHKVPHARIVWPVHPNPEVSKPVKSQLDSVPHVFLIPPLDYPSFVWMMKHSYLILTDSGGVQEEAPSFGKPVLVLRKKTERPEAIQAGTARLIGTNPKTIVRKTLALIKEQGKYQKMARRVNPFGDGKSCLRIIKILEEEL